MEEAAKKFGFPDSASCAEVVYDVLELMEAPRQAEVLDRIYVGLSTDTGCFRFANTTAHTFRVAAACAEGGARVYQLNQELFETNTLGKLRMQGWIVEHMRLLHCGTMAICAIPRSVELELGVTSDDMDNISNFPRTVAGVNVAATIRETEDGLAKISVRAVPGYDATVIAEKFGGGGHKGAAGASLRLPMAQVEQIVAQDIPLLRHRAKKEEAIARFAAEGQGDKARLLQWRSLEYCSEYSYGDYTDNFYGEMAPSTG